MATTQESESDHQTNGSIIDVYTFKCTKWIILRGYIRMCQESMQNAFRRIPAGIRELVWRYFYRSLLELILEDDNLKRYVANTRNRIF